MKKLIALDGDGVIFDYRQAFPVVWQSAFGELLEMVQPNAYHATTAYGVEWESDAQREKFFECFDEEVWATMPIFDGVVEACELLVEAGNELVIVSSMNHNFGVARLRNCMLYSLPITEVHAVKRVKGEGNPKLEVLHKLQPDVLVDDLMDNFEGLVDIHKAFIYYGRFDCPSLISSIKPDSCHSSLLDFAKFWV